MVKIPASCRKHQYEFYVLDHAQEIDALILSGSGTVDGLARMARSAPAGSNTLRSSGASPADHEQAA